MTKRTAIDPTGCGCTDCLTGASVPLDQATQEQLIDAICGYASLRTDEEIDIEISMVITREDLEHPTLPTHRDAVMGLLDAGIKMSGTRIAVVGH